MLAHAEIVVGAPDGDLLRPAVGPPDGAREGAGDALEIGEDAVAALRVDLVDCFPEKPLIVHAGILAGTVLYGLRFFTSTAAASVKMPRPA
jgi:hypothetical protein